MECSGVVRNAYRKLGHNAWSCDLKAPEITPGLGHLYHLRGDVRRVLNGTIPDDMVEFSTWRGGGKPILINWDVAIFHPDCTYLTCSAEWAYGDGPYHMKLNPRTLVGAARRAARAEAVALVRQLQVAPIPKIAIENPRGHLSSVIGKPQQTIQPHQFGDDASKATCLWLKNLPLLVPTKQIAPRLVDDRPRWGNQTDTGQNRLSPSEHRAADRARTYPGIAAAMAAQWNY
jgi:hypothetical protein